LFTVSPDLEAADAGTGGTGAYTGYVGIAGGAEGAHQQAVPRTAESENAPAGELSLDEIRLGSKAAS